MIDPNEAPEGYRAEALTAGCMGCDLAGSVDCMDAKCGRLERVDGRPVIFKRIGPVMAIYATPCDDMGAHV